MFRERVYSSISKIKTRELLTFSLLLVCVCKKKFQKTSSPEYSLPPGAVLPALLAASKFVDFRKKCFLSIAVEFACLVVSVSAALSSIRVTFRRYGRYYD